MVRVTFTPNIQRHVTCPPQSVHGSTVREILDCVFTENRKARSYVLDEQGVLRKHMNIFINGHAISDRDRLSDAVSEGDEVYVMQALSGGLNR